MSARAAIIGASVSAFVTGLAAIVVYLSRHVLPLTEVYLGDDIEQYSLLVFILAVPGLFVYWWGRRRETSKGLRIVCYAVSALLLLGVPLLAFVRHAGSFRGASWALETLLIGAVPVLFLLAGVLVLGRQRWVGMLLALFFVLVGAYHLFLLIKVLANLNEAFSSYSLTDAVIAALIAAISLGFAWLNLVFFRHPESHS